MRHTLITLFSLLAILALVLPIEAAPVQAAPAQPADSLAQLPFSVRITPTVLDWFNQVARPEDIASFGSRDLSLLGQVTRGRKQVIFASAADAEQQVPALAGQIAFIGYDLEHWPQTPADEQADPVSAVKRMRALADKYGLQLVVGPDRRFTADYGTDIAPYADYYVLQLQRLQSDSQALHTFADPLIQGLRQANPKIHIVVQLAASSSPADVVSLIESMKAQIDAVGLLTNAASLPAAKDVVAQLQAGSAAVSAKPTPPDSLLPPVSNPAQVPTPAPMPQPHLPLLRITFRRGVIIAGLALLAVIAVAALVLAVVFASDRRTRRKGAPLRDRRDTEDLPSRTNDQ